MNQCTLSQQKEIIDIIQYKFILNGETTIKDLESEISENVIKDFKFTEFKDNSEITNELIKNGINIEELFDTDSSSTIYKSNVVKNISTYSIDDLFKGIPVAKKYFDSYLGEIIVREAIIGRGDSDHYVDNDHELSENFNNLKNKLFIEIQEFLQSEGLLSTDVVELFENERIIDYAYYNHIMGLVSDYFFSGENVGLLTFEGKLVPNLNIDLDSKEHLFKAYNNAILLTNFDSIINTEFKGMIEINYNYFNHLNNSIGRNPKYRLKVAANSLLYWNRDNHDSKSSENKEDQITKMVVNSIPAYNKNNQKLPESMEMKDLYLLGSMIHSFELKYGNKFKNNDVEFEYFNKNPGQSLVWYLQKIIQAFNKEGDYISEFNDSLKIGERGGFNFRDVINLAYSLNNYINNPELNILAKEKTSTNSLLSIIGQVINNNFGVIYSVFNTDSGLEVQNMHQQDFNSTYINNTVLSYMVTNALNKDMYDLKNKEELDKFNGIFDTAFEEDRNQDIYIYSLNNPSIVEEFSEYISEKTGIPFSNFSFVDLINEMKIQHNKTRIEVSFFKNKVSEFINSINQDFKNKTFKSYITKATSVTSGKVLNNTVSNAFYKSLSKTYLTNFITKPAMNLTTELGSKVPSFRTSTLTFKDTEIFDLQRTYEKTEGTSYRSLLLKDSSAILGTSTKLEVTNPLTEDEYNSVKDAAKLTPQESFIADFRYEFWDSLMKQDTFQIILGNYSDKNTVFTKIINGRFQLEGSKKIIIQEDMDVLLETVRTQAFKYYSDTFKKVFKDYKELFSKTGFENEANQITDDFENNIKVINNILLRNNIIDLLSIYAELPFSLKNPNLTITEELHYSNYWGGTSINQLLADNYRIFGNINLFNEFVSIQEQSFMDKTVSNQNNTLNHMNSAKGDFNQIASKLGLNFDEFSDEFDKIQLKSGKLNPIVRKWMWLNALFRNEYTFMTSKGEYMHPHKNNSTFRSGEFNGDYWSKYSLEMSGRLDSMAKRNVIFTASIESPVRNSKYGTTEKVNIAAIQDSKAQVYTSSGHKKYNQDAYDGSSYIEDLHSRMLTASFPGKGYGGTMKQFGTMITPYSVTLKKDAETVLTNDRIRNSHSSTNSLLNKKNQMLSIPLNDIIFNDDVLRFEDLYINHLGKQYQIYRVELTNESGQNKLKLFNSLLEDSDKLDQPILEVNVNTLYDIWDAFGGIYSIDENGNFNEKSNEALYNVVTETNDGKLKNKLIHILSNVSSLKAGATNINSSARWQDSKPLLYSTYDNRFMGPQLDASHGIDNSEIKEVTQLVSALAQGGFTSEVAQEAYEDIANVIKTSAQPYLNSMKADDKKLYYYLTDKFIETINNAKGESIAKTLIHSIKEDGINIPFSNNNFFGLFVRDVVTRLNNEFISRHYSGIGSVLIPSHGIFQVYDRVLPDGRTIVMTQADLIKEALQEYDSIEFERIYGRQPVNNEEIIEFYKSTILADLSVNIGEIEVGDTVLINGQNLSLSTPEEYYRFKRSYQQDTVTKVYSKPRDLKPTSHTFKVNGQQKNIFDFKSLELLYKNKEIIDSLNKGEQIVIDGSVILLNDFSNYISHKNNKSFDLLNNLNKNSIDVLKTLEKYLRQWVQRDFELLHEGLAMTNHISNFSEYFGNDNFTDMLSDVIENYRLYAQPVTDVVFKSAEKVVGDIYQTNFGRDLNDSMYEINKKGALFFKEKLLKYYGKDNVEADLKIISDKSDKPIYIKYVDELGLLDRTINIKSAIKSEDDLKRTYIRYNELGEEIYSFTNSDNVRVSTDEDGNEIIYVRFGKKHYDDRKRIYGHHKTKSFEKNVKGIIKSFKGSIKAVVPLMNRDARTTSFFSYDENGIIPKGNYNFNFGEFTTEVFKNFTGIEVLEDHVYSSDWFERNKDNILDRMSNSMYISWQKSHELIDARIPGQSMQSFMPMKNIAYMNTTTNDSYVSITQIFLQGSDFDIDKAYTLGSGFTSHGKLDLWTNLSEYSSIEQLNELEKLPLPTNRQITLANPDITEELNLEEVENINATEDYNDIVESIAIYGGTMNTNYQFPAETIKLFNKFLRKYNHLDNIVITSVSNRLSREKFIDLINAHNLDSSFRNKEGVVKNSVVSRIKQIISDPRNQILANTPVTVQDWHDAIKIVEDRKSQTLINSSHSGNVKVAGREGIPKFMDSKRNRNYKAMKEYAIKNDYIYTLREQGNEHFGNPYSNMNVKGTIPTKSTKESVEKFIDWILYNPDEIQENRRQWILTQLINGSLKNKPLLYYNDLREPSHANALDYLINQFDWSNTVLTPEQTPEEIDEKSNVINSLYTNHSGGADGSDSYWDYIGRTHGLKNHRHYFIQGFDTPKGNIGLSSDFIKEATEHVLNANKTLRRQYPTKVAYVNNLLLRNWAQVKNADTVFAIGKLKGNEVEGGTGWAVQMAIDNLKPVFVFDQFKNNWYEYNYELGLFKKSDIPVLTKNFAGIGTREINSLGIQAIKDVYNKTLGTIDYDSTEIYREITKNTEVKNLKGEQRPLITESFLETNKKFREIPVIISDDFKGAASFNKKTRTIQINIPLMKQKFEEKAWSKSNTLKDNTKVDPFPEEQFSNFEEWLTFVVLHEYYHSKLERKRFDNGNLEPLNVYENRINEHAFKTLRDTYNTDIANVDESKIEMVTEEKSTKLNNKKLLSSYDMMSYYMQQYNASVGKDDVGIAANGVKTLYALSSYYNTYYKNNNFEPDLVNSFKSFNKNFTFLKNGELMSLGGNFTTIADVQMNNVQRKMFEEFDSSFNIKFVNAANNLSGFLSAATDNAKELIMAKVNASADLASMHIYLMILGLDIDQVVEIMTSDIMEDIINKMDHNVFSMKRKLSFNTVINELSKIYKNRGDNDSIYNLNTYLNIYKAASELTSLSTLLGINQKRKATTWEIYNYLNTFSKTLVNSERNKIPRNILETYKLRKNPEEIIKYIHTISRQTNIEEIVNSAHALGIIGGSFDFERYFAEPSYKQATKEYYNLIKETFNVFDILDEVPHFREMVNSLVLFHNILKKYSTKYNYIFDLFRDSIGDTNPTEDIIKRGILYNDSRAREEWFKTDKMLDFSFDLKDLMKMAKKDNFTLYTSSSAQKNIEKEKHSIVVDINDDSNPLISLENNEGIANFKNAFEQLLLPILQSNLKNNNFLKLENTINPFGIQTSHVAPTVATSNINVPALVKQFQKALKTFDDLDTSFDIDYQIKNNLSEFVKWKDIIFVYNLIVNNERYGDKRITPLLQNYMHDKNSLGYDYIKFWSGIDNGLELMNESSETDIKFYVSNIKGIDLIRSLYGDNPDFPIITNVQETEQIKIHNKNINDIIRLIKEGGYIITLKC